MVQPANSRQLAVPSANVPVRIQPNGEPSVLELAGSHDEAFVVAVTVSKDNKIETTPRGAMLEIVDPDGTTITAPSDGPLSVFGGGKPGTYLVGIGDSSGQTKRTYSVSISPVPIRTAAPASPQWRPPDRLRTERFSGVRVARSEAVVRRVE